MLCLQTPECHTFAPLWLSDRELFDRLGVWLYEAHSPVFPGESKMQSVIEIGASRRTKSVILIDWQRALMHRCPHQRHCRTLPQEHRPLWRRCRPPICRPSHINRRVSWYAQVKECMMGRK